MAANSTMLPLGTPAPEFRLTDAVSGKVYSLKDFADSPVLVVMFICNHCPFVKHIQAELALLARDYQPAGVAFVAINSNDPQTYPDDAPDKMAAIAKSAGYGFPYLFDETQAVAKAYRAACTPDFYVFDSKRKLAYRGQLDDSRPKSDIPVTGHDLRTAIDSVLAGRQASESQKPSVGCGIKWKPGNAPDYAS